MSTLYTTRTPYIHYISNSPNNNPSIIIFSFAVPLHARFFQVLQALWAAGPRRGGTNDDEYDDDYDEDSSESSTEDEESPPSSAAAEEYASRYYINLYYAPYMHRTYITDRHTYIHAYMHTCIHAYIHYIANRTYTVYSLFIHYTM